MRKFSNGTWIRVKPKTTEDFKRQGTRYGVVTGYRERREGLVPLYSIKLFYDLNNNKSHYTAIKEERIANLNEQDQERIALWTLIN